MKCRFFRRAMKPITLREPLKSNMTKKNQSVDLKELEDKLDELIERYTTVQNENVTLKTKQDTLVKEKAQLLEKTNLARTRVEAMLSRLKDMEHDK